MKKILFIFLLGTLMVLPLMAGPIRMALRDTTILRGSTIAFPVWVDSSVTDSAVKSFELDLSYSADPLLIDSVIISGTMTEGWGMPAVRYASGRITIAGAGTTPLSGTGVLFFLRIKFPLSSAQTYTSISFNKAFLNEGSPTTITRNATITITNLPVITVSPNTALLTVGNTQQFYASGGKLPYTWLTTDPDVATINSSGLLTALHGGVCYVVAVDSNGITDTSGMIDVRSFLLTIRDTSYLQGQTLNIPVYISDLSLVELQSGTFTVAFNPNILTALGVVRTGTLLESFSEPATRISSGAMTVAFASDTAHLRGTGSSILLYLRFKITDINNYSTQIQITDNIFNELIVGNVDNGYFTVLPRANLILSPNTATLIAGDSLQFSVSGGATPPVAWSVSDPTLATISTGGKLKAIKSGIVQVSVIDFVGAQGTSGDITLYDMRIRLLNCSGSAGDTVNMPVDVGTYAEGMYSTQMVLTYNQNYFVPLQIVTGGTLFEGRTSAFAIPSPGTVNLTAAGASPVSGPGTLIMVRFKILQTAPLGSYPVNFSSILLNEGKPLAFPSNGQIIVGATDVGDNPTELPATYELDQNYPNPFNPTTIIKYDLPRESHVTIKIFNLIGQEVATLLDEDQEAGYKSVEWNAASLPSGMYIYRITAGSFSDVKKLMLVK